MINVLIPVDSALADGTAYQDPISIHEFHEPQLEKDCAVKVVPPEALQALLKLSKSFATYEKRFGQVSDRDRAEILALFSLIEEERTWDNAKREEYLKWTLIKRREERKEAKIRRSPEQAVKMARILAEYDKASLEKRGRLRTITDNLNGREFLRVWWDRKNETLSVGVLVRSFRDALTVLLLLNLGNPESVAVCARCHKRFTRTKTTQDFCSLRCGNAARKARQRLKSKGEADVTRKTR